MENLTLENDNIESQEARRIAEKYSLENATTRILKSKFFHPSFNTAIFDGPLRVYFTQAQEPEALKIYFSLQSKTFKEESTAEERSLETMRREPKSTLFVMIYPNKELFAQSFDKDADFAVAQMERDVVIGVNGPLSDKTRDDILAYVRDNFKAE